MPGIPGKGGKAGRSGRKPGPTADWPVLSVRLPPDLHERAKAAGRVLVAKALDSGLP